MGEYQLMRGFMGIGMLELLVILLIMLLLFGAKKLPELAKGLGSGVREFKKAMKETGDESGNGVKTATAESESLSTEKSVSGNKEST